MNKTKQEMLALVDDLKNLFHTPFYPDMNYCPATEATGQANALRTLITNSIIVSEEELEGLRREVKEDFLPIYEAYEEACNMSFNTAIDKVKGMK